MTPGPVLRDIHLPAEPGWWPPAPGWWVLALLLLVALAAVVAWMLRAYRRRQRLRRLDALVDAALQRHADEAAAGALAAELSQLLRRGARARDPAAAALDGNAWLRWLDGDDPSAPFSLGAGRVLVDAPYRPSPPRAAIEAAVPLVRARLRSLATGAARG